MRARRIDPRDAPLYVVQDVRRASRSTWTSTCGSRSREGLHGWQVTDCVVTVTKIAYSLADGPPSRRGPMPTARDLKRLVPLVLMQALEQGGIGGLRAGLPGRRRGADGGDRPAARRPSAASAPELRLPSTRGELSVLEATLSASGVQELRRQLPGLTGGEGVLDSEFAGYRARGRRTSGPADG